VWLVGVVVVLAAAAFAKAVAPDGPSDWVSDAARSAQVSAPTDQGTPGAGGAGAGSARADTDSATADTALAESESRPRWVSTRERVRRHEALPCTGPRDPVNFEVFSAGPAVGGVQMTGAVRTCDDGALADEETNNHLAYIYGECQSQTEDGAGCLPPLQIRSYPACQRTYVDYSFEGKPLPYTELPPINGAKVIEIEFLVDHRIEIYSGDSTIVISAADWSLAEEALEQLRSQPPGTPPATSTSSLVQGPQGSLEPPAKAAIEGDLPCHV
jgi:hypothetical protein